MNLYLIIFKRLYLVSKYRNFRPKHFYLGLLRPSLPLGIPSLSVSEILDPKKLAIV